MDESQEGVNGIDESALTITAVMDPFLVLLPFS